MRKHAYWDQEHKKYRKKALPHGQLIEFHCVFGPHRPPSRPEQPCLHMEPVQLGRLPLAQSNSPGCKVGMSSVMGCRPNITPSKCPKQFRSTQRFRSTNLAWVNRGAHPRLIRRKKNHEGTLYTSCQEKRLSFHLMSKYLRVSFNLYISVHHLHNSH